MPDDQNPDHHRLALQTLEEENRRLTAANSQLASELNRYRLLIDSASDLIHSVTPEGRFIYTNRAWRDALGYSEEEISSLSLFDIIDRQCVEKCQTIFNSLIHGEKIDRNTTTFTTRSGEKLLVEGRCTTHFENGNAQFMTGIFRDLTDSNRREMALQESEKKYRDLFESSSNLIQIVQPDGRLKYVNKAWRDTFGYSEDEVASLSIFDLIAKDCQGHCQTVFQQVISAPPKLHHINTTFTSKDGRQILIEGSAICNFENDKPTFTQCIFHDVTEKRRLEEEVIKAQKLESLGILAGGIAHDFNNLLTAILGNISLARMYTTPGEEISGYLDKTEKASIRAQGLTKQLLTFAKGGAPVKKTTSLPELIRDCSHFILQGSSTKCTCHFEDGLKSVEVDEGQLSQVVQNLVINASQAMPDGGTITIRGRNRLLAEGQAGSLPTGEYIEILFEDHGIGIPAEDLPRIFDPYFSSKINGSGLGLAISYSIIQKHGGLISASSRPGIGTTFTILLPVSRYQAKSILTEMQSTPISPLHVLVMDDDNIILDLAVAMLEIMQCQAQTATDGKEALTLYDVAKKAGTPFDLVIMDLTIPGGMGGKEAITFLLALDPAARVIVSSGYANDPIMANYSTYGFRAVLPKPFKFEELNQAIVRVMENGDSSSLNP